MNLNSEEVCELLNVLSGAADVVRQETSAKREDDMILSLYIKAKESRLNVYPVVTIYYNNKNYKHLAKSDDEIIKNSYFVTKKPIDEYPPYSRIYKDFSFEFTNGVKKYKDCEVKYFPNEQVDKNMILFSIYFTLNDHKYGVDFNYSNFNHYPNSIDHIVCLYSRDLEEIEFYDKDELPYDIYDIIRDTYKYVENSLITDRTRCTICDYITMLLHKLEFNT